MKTLKQENARLLEELNQVIQTLEKEREKSSKATLDYYFIKKEFEQYKKESIKWSILDFWVLEVEGYEINQEQAQIALEKMIYNHDANEGINWETVNHYYREYGTKL